LGEALELEADRMRGLTLDPAEFEAEKAVVLEELAMGLDDPWRRLSQRMHESLFARHPYRRPVIGYVDTLQRMQPADMRAYYERFYHPGNATIVICGDIRKRPTLAKIRAHFGQIAAGPPAAQVDCFRPALDEPLGEQRFVTYWDDSATRIMMAWPTVPVGVPEDDCLDVISTVLSGGRLARLHRRLVLEAGLATSIATNNATMVEGGAFWLYAECVQGVEAHVLEAAIDVELERLARELVPAAELTRAKRTLAATEAYEGETVTDLAENIGEYAIDADWHLALDGRERIARVRATDVRKNVARFLTRPRRVVGWSLPEQERERVGG
jgi:zinc protease